ncbi:MAG TPA: PucR family transcriptional regulator [Solirubrobacteraceae bacterium]|nr:PucR family transcriptional regulator [Solirubrobacteraceae bacterium]
MLTVREVLGDLDVEVLAGEANLDAPVRWVHISELRDPTPWLSGGELLLTTGLALDTPERQRDFIATLADHGLAGVGLGTGFTHETVPDAMVEAAAERAFPLFEVPYELPFIALTEQAFTRLVNEQYALLQRSIAAQERLQRIVLSERGLEAIVGALATLVGGAALVFDGRGELQAMRTFRRELDGDVIGALAGELRDRARRGDGKSFVPGHPDLAPRGLALPVGAGDASDRGAVPPAWLVAVKDSGGLAEIDRLILHQAVTVVALELLRRRVADSTERRLAGDVLSAVIDGDLEGAELGRRLEPFGLGGRVSALVLAPADRDTPQACEAALADALRAEAVSGLVAANGRFACALLPGFLDDELFELGERVVVRAAEALAARPAAGAGRAVPVARAREAYHEARCALEARELGPTASNGTNGAARDESAGPLATYRDLGSFQLLLSLQDSDALRLFCDSLLGPIEHGEGHYGGELMRSLEAFIECNGQWESAARRLYCHRHTLRYRIRKIEELTGRNLGSARDRIEFWLALRGREIVRHPTTTERP